MDFDVGMDVGGVFGSVASGLFNRSQARQNRSWQEYMSNTAHRREAEDLEAAGLNRILSLGSGASTPGGAQATMPDLGLSFTAGRQATTAREAQKSAADLQEKQGQQALASAKQADATANATTAMLPYQAAETVARTMEVQQRARSAEYSADREKIMNDLIKKAGPGISTLVDALGTGVNSAVSLGKDVVQGIKDVVEKQGTSAKQLITGENPKEGSIPGFIDFLISPSKWQWTEGMREELKKSRSKRRN